MQMHPVRSTTAAAVGHDGTKLRIVFTNGLVYDYTGAPASALDGLLAGGSVGKYLIHWRAWLRHLNENTRGVTWQASGEVPSGG